MLIGKNYPQQSNFSFSNGQKIGILLFGFFERIEETTICLRDRSLYSYLLKVTKGKIISKGLLVSSNSPKKRTNEFLFTTTTHSFVHFLREIEDTKESFRNYLTFNKYKYLSKTTEYKVRCLMLISVFIANDIYKQIQK